MRLKHAMKTQMRMSLHIGKTNDHHLEACCKGISSIFEYVILFLFYEAQCTIAVLVVVYCT